MPNDPSMTLTDPAAMFHQALDNAGIPIDGVGLPDPEQLPPDWNIVTRPDGLVVHIGYKPEATPEQIVEGDNIVMTLDITPKRVRSIWDIYANIAALSNAQKDAISTNLKVSNGAKYKSLGVPQDGTMLALEWAAGSGLGNVQARDVYCRMAALYTQQNVHYLEKPAWAPTINIPGWEVIPPDQMPRRAPVG